MADRELADVILKGLVARRLPEWSERVKHIAQETLRDLGGGQPKLSLPGSRCNTCRTKSRRWALAGR